MPNLPETPSGWLGSSERATAQKLSAARGRAARATGLMDGSIDVELKASFERTTKQVSRFLNAPVGLFSLLEGECQVMIASTGYPGPTIIPAESSMCVHVRDSGRDIIVDDLTRHELAEIAGNMAAAGANAYLGTPVFSPDGQPIGSLCAIDFPSRSWEPSDLDLLRALAEGLTDKIALLQSVARAEASEARLTATLEAIPNIVFLSNEEGEITYVSPQLERNLGIRSEEVVGHGWTEVVHPDDLAQATQTTMAAGAKPAPYEMEFRLPDREGEYRQFLIRGVPIGDEGGEVTFLSTATEIEEIRQVERELAEERGRLTALLESLPHLVWISDDRGDISYVGPQAVEFLGYQPEELTGQVWAELIHPDDLGRVVEIVMSLATRQGPFEVEYRLRRADGTYRQVLARGARTRDSGGHAQFVCTATDIDEIRATERELDNERARLAALMEAIPHIVVLSSPETGIDFVSPQVRAILGHDPEDVTGFGFYDRVIHPEDREGLRSQRLQLLGSAEPFEYEFRALHADGRHVPMLLRGFPLPQVAEMRHSHVVTFTEIGAIRAAEELTEEERRRLQGVLDVLPTGLMIAEEQGKIVLSNGEAARLFGDRFDTGFQDGGWPQAYYMEPDGSETLMTGITTPIHRALLGESVRDDRLIRLLAEDGGERFVKCDAETLRTPDGIIEGAVMVAKDITELRQAETRIEAERRAGSERIRTMLDAMPILTALVDLEGRILHVSEGVLNAAGVELSTVTGVVAWESVFVEGNPEAATELRRVLELGLAGETVTTEITFNWVGKLVETRYYVVPIFDADGAVTALSVSAVEVTELNEARRRVEAEGEMLRQVMDHSPIMKGLLDPEGRILFANEALLQGVETTLDRVRGKLIWETPWAQKLGVAEVLRHASERAIKGETVLDEISFRSPDRGLIEIEQRIAPIYAPDGTLQYLLPTGIDVTVRNRAAREVAEERTRLRTILDLLPAGLLISDAEGNIVDGNDEGRRFFGSSSYPGESGMLWPEAWYLEFDGGETPLLPGEGPMHTALRGEAVREPRTIRMIGIDGTERFVKCDAQPLISIDGNVAGAVMTILDITSLRRARDEADRARVESIERLQRVIDSLPINVVLADPQGHLLYANEAPLKGAGLKLEDVVGKLAWESAWMPNEETARITKEEYMKAAAGEIAHREFTIQMGNAAADVDHTVVPIFGSDGKVEFLLPSSIDVTERNRALRDVDRERRRLSQVVEGMPVGLFVFDRNMSLVQANEEALKTTGLTPERLARGEVPELWYVEPDGSETPTTHQEAPSWRALRGENGRETRPMRLHHEGTDPADDLYVHIEAAPLTNAAGEIEGAIVTAVDVKPLLEAEKALAREREASAALVEEERRRLRQIVENLPIGLFVFDKNRTTLHANEEGLHAFGITREQMEAGEYAEAVYIEPDGTETVADLDTAPLRRVLRGENGREPRIIRLFRSENPEFEERYVRAEAAALTDSEGEIEGAVFTVVDVKPLREAELALGREREAATERLTATLEGVSIFIGLLDLQGRVVWCNKAPLQATGIAFSDVENVRFEDSLWVNHDPEMMRRIGDATRRAAGGEMAFTPVVARRVGGLMDVDLTLAPIRGQDGAVRYIVASGIEVTARNAAIRQIEDARMSAERAREIAERATRAKDEFLAVLSHELRTPLTPAMLGLELLGGDLDEILPSANDPLLAASIQETMATVRSNLDIQVRLIDDLLDVTRIARDKLELRKSPVDLHDAARHALSIVAPRAAEKEVSTALVPSAPRSLVLADPARLRQILWNLLANAVKFTEGGGEIRVETEEAGPEMVRLKVIDTGLGIDPERLTTIFDAFDQGEGAVSRGFGGLGLGLAIARSLARAHGGTLWATSAGKGQGATFVLELPTIEASVASDSPTRQRLVRQEHAGCRVLLIEDNLDTARFTAALLRRAEIQVEVAHSVADALAVSAGKPWDAILTDIGLPDGDGVEAVHRLRIIGIDAPAVAMSGYGRDEDKARTADAGFRAHLVKPVVFENLLEVLDAVLPANCD